MLSRLARQAAPAILRSLRSTTSNVVVPYSRLAVAALGHVAPMAGDRQQRAASDFPALSGSPLDTVNMMCFQCEQTTKGEGCTTIGVCGKTPEVSALQDLLIYSLKGLGGWAHHARTVANITDDEVDSFVNAATFSTLTNVNFDALRFQEYLARCHTLIKHVREAVRAAGAPPLVAPSNVGWFGALPHPFDFTLDDAALQDLTGLIDMGHQVGIAARHGQMKNATLLGLHELLTYGIKGAAAYMHHAEVLGARDPQVAAEFQEYYNFLCTADANDANAVLAKCLDLGKTNLRVMELLERAHVGNFGIPEPTTVRTAPKKGKAILITGHDMGDLKALLEQTKGTGVNVYTHGEMLPGHAYPELKKYDNLVGNWGGAWYRQKKEFPHFPGAIVSTTNCILDPLETYRSNLFTMGETGLSNVTHCPPRDFTAVIKRAQELPGFAEDGPEDARQYTVGFGKDTLLSAAPAVLDAFKAGNLRHLFLVGGCDGSEPQRRYYAKLSDIMPKDTMVLTLGCAKYRILDQEWGNVPGTQLPRLADVGQCNSSYDAIQVALALAKALDTDVNSLPLSLSLSWLEQKAAAVLLTLLHLGVKNIQLGPRMPAFLTPEATQILVDAYGLQPPNIKNPEEDINRMLSRA